jgi:hypothetical protein
MICKADTRSAPACHIADQSFEYIPLTPQPAWADVTAVVTLSRSGMPSTLHVPLGRKAANVSCNMTYPSQFRRQFLLPRPPPATIPVPNTSWPSTRLDSWVELEAMMSVRAIEHVSRLSPRSTLCVFLLDLSHVFWSSPR